MPKSGDAESPRRGSFFAAAIRDDERAETTRHRGPTLRPIIDGSQ